MDYVGQKCRTMIPIHRGAPRAAAAEAEALAREVLDAKCRAVGLTATSLMLVSTGPWAENPDLDVLCFEATAAR